MRKLIRFILRTFGVKYTKMSKIKDSGDFTTVTIDKSTYKIESIEAVRPKDLTGKGEHYGIEILFHSGKDEIGYLKPEERDEDLRKLGNLMKGKLNVN